MGNSKFILCFPNCISKITAGIRATCRANAAPVPMGGSDGHYCRSPVMLTVLSAVNAVRRTVRWVSPWLGNSYFQEVCPIVDAEWDNGCLSPCISCPDKAVLSRIFVAHGTVMAGLCCRFEIKLNLSEAIKLIFPGSEQWNKDHLWNPVSRDDFRKTKSEIKRLV